MDVTSWTLADIFISPKTHWDAAVLDERQYGAKRVRPVSLPFSRTSKRNAKMFTFPPQARVVSLLLPSVLYEAAQIPKENLQKPQKLYARLSPANREYARVSNQE